ncbi:hypothetical protein [Pelomonas cellulosilytica]|uniref:Minor tail protein n=1 Tax=Pelomonas cellulosilytica TaxID=2906762 RepID=A0ABS8Y2T5_9BURK|nr:hypothetical protein [Pelomonas sp. P8]MCE4557369.1 hypothetical protein [Pelomonas sp. P8]
MPTDLVYADAVPSSASLFSLGSSRWLVSNLIAESSAIRLAATGSNAYAGWVELDKRTPGGATSTGRLKLASVSQTAWNVGTASISAGGLVEGRGLAIAASEQAGGAIAAWVEYAMAANGTEWRIRSAPFGAGGVSAVTEVFTLPDTSAARVDKLLVRFNADGSPEIFWLVQTWRAGTGEVGSSALWRAVRAGAGWQASQLRHVSKGTIDDLTAWGGDTSGQSGLAWLERVGSSTKLMTAPAASLPQGQPTMLATAAAITEVQSSMSSGLVALAWRASECTGSIRQTTSSTVKPLAVATAAITTFTTCLSVREGSSPWKDARTLGTLTSSEFDTSAVAVRPSGEILVVWSGEIGAYKQVAAASCTTNLCSPASTLATPNMGPIARAAVTSTTSGFAVSWVDIDPYAQNLTATQFVRMTAAGAMVGLPNPVRGVFYGSGMSPTNKEPMLVATGDSVLLGWRTERFNTDATSDFNAAWIAP